MQNNFDRNENLSDSVCQTMPGMEAETDPSEMYGLGNIGRVNEANENKDSFPFTDDQIERMPPQRYREPKQQGQLPPEGFGFSANTPFNGFNRQQADALRMPYGSFQRTLEQHIGYFVVCEFFVGAQQTYPVTKYGILYDVGAGYIVLFDDVMNRYIVCDFYSLRFITFYNSSSTPQNFRGQYRG